MVILGILLGSLVDKVLNSTPTIKSGPDLIHKIEKLFIKTPQEKPNIDAELRPLRALVQF